MAKNYRLCFKVVIKNAKIKAKWFLAKIAWHYLCQETERKNGTFLHTACLGKIFGGAKQPKPRKDKTTVSAQIA